MKTKRKVAVHLPEFPAKKVVFKAKWIFFPEFGIAELRLTEPYDGISVYAACPIGKRLHRVFGTKPRKLRITIEEV